MPDILFTITMFAIWLFIGSYNMVIAKNISRFAFFACWVTLLLYIIATSVL